MGYIKNYKQNEPKRNYRAWALLIIMIFIISVGLVFTKHDKTPQPQYDYTLKISNWVGSENYQFDYYKKDGKTYKLYNKDSIKINEVIPANDNTIIIIKNK